MLAALKKFGKVKQCRVKNGKFECLITTGFDCDSTNAQNCFNEAIKVAGSNYPKVETYKAEKNFFHLVLKPEACNEKRR